jgi:hypothetical protein
MKVALTGKLYSGKTTIAKLLEGLHGYTLVNFSDYLKGLALNSLSVVDERYQGMTIREMNRDKQKYRPFLQEFGTLIGFDAEAMYIGRVLSLVDSENVVFDNVRTQAQADLLTNLGYKIIKLNLTDSEQSDRAYHMGTNVDEMFQQQGHDIENRSPGPVYRVYQAGRNSAEQIAEWIAKDEAEPKPKERAQRPNRRNDRYIIPEWRTEYLNGIVPPPFPGNREVGGRAFEPVSGDAIPIPQFPETNGATVTLNDEALLQLRESMANTNYMVRYDVASNTLSADIVHPMATRWVVDDSGSF